MILYSAVSQFIYTAMQIFRAALISVVLAVSASYTGLEAQSLDGGIAIGLSAYDGELGRIEPLDKIGSSRFAYGAFVRASFNEFVAARVYYHRSELHGADSLEERRASRNLSFQTNVDELGLLVEYYPLGDKYLLSPYVFGGVAGYAFDPETEFQGGTVELQPLGTEGQGRPGFEERYSLQRLAMPLGAGLRLKMGPRFWIAGELGARLVFFDYLDDVGGVYADPNVLGIDGNPTAVALADRRTELVGGTPAAPGTARGSLSNNDYYVVASFTFSYRFRQSDGSSSRKAKTDCYRF